MTLSSLPLYRCGMSDGVEKVTGYQTGGYCPISIGQILDDKYEIIAKLGYGGSSTVWMAEDREYNRWVALKILKSDKSSKDNTELTNLQSFQQSSIVQCFDNFWIQSPNGCHLCLVMEVTGPSLAQYIESLWYGELNSDTVIDLSRQCIKALKTLHDLGYAHGDVCSANFVLGLSDISTLTKESMQRYVGNYQSGVVSSRDGSALPPGMPERLFRSVSLKDLVDLSRVVMIDLREAFSGWKEDVATHLAYTAPELLAEKGATVQSDIWSIGCLICELVTSYTPFCGSSTITKGQASFFAKSSDEQYGYLREFLVEHSVLKYEEENDMLAELLCEILVQDPQKRVNLRQLLEHDFFKFAGCPPDLEK